MAYSNLFNSANSHRARLLTKVGQMDAQLRANNKIYEAKMQRIERKSIKINRKENP